MNLISGAIHDVINRLHRQQLLVLHPGCTTAQLADEILAKVASAPRFSQLGPFLGQAIVGSALVEELYADDRQIVQLLSGMGPDEPSRLGVQRGDSAAEGEGGA